MNYPAAKEPEYAKIVQYIRNGLVEQEHRGIIIHMNKSGVINKIGNDNNYKFYMRSCMKPLQASVLIDLGIDEKYKLTERELAVCCASHAGDKIHQKLVKSVLNKTGFTEKDLLCPEHEPLSAEECRYLIKNELQPERIHNNCSGKHAAMLAVCREKGFPIENYADFDNPLTDFIINHVMNLCGLTKEEIVISKDGCTLPVIAAPLEAMGRGFLEVFTSKKYEKIKNAFLNNPFIIGGDNRTDTKIIRNTKDIAAKTGACGLLAIVNTKKEETAIIKTADSNMEAREIAAFEILKQLKWI